MKNYLNNKQVAIAIAFLVAVGFVNAVGIVSTTSDNMLAQVFQVSAKPIATYTYSANDNNFGQQTGLTFKVNRRLEVKACSGGGAGGGGGRGQESGNNVGSGGGGGEGGKSGTCLTRSVKLRAGDTLRWLVGAGGTGGSPGHLKVVFDPQPGQTLIDNSPTDGQNGGTTYVSVNGVDVMQINGGRGGIAGTNASGECLPGIGGPSVWYVQDHPELGLGEAYFSPGKGHNGEGCDSIDPHDDGWSDVFHSDYPWIGFGGKGGKGQTLNGTYSGNEGDWGITGNFINYGSHIFGGDGGIGNPMGSSGGGGGGGGSGLWNDIGDQIIENRGGWGGNGTPGSVTITVYAI